MMPPCQRYPASPGVPMVVVEARGELVSCPAGLQCRPGIDPALVPGAISPGRDQQRGEGGVGQLRVTVRNHSAATS